MLTPCCYSPGLRSLQDTPPHLHRPPEPAPALPAKAAIPLSTRHFLVAPSPLPQLAHAIGQDQHGRHLLQQVMGYRREQLLPSSRGESDGARAFRFPRVERSSQQGRAR